MICPKRKEKGVLNQVLHKEFYYCRTCKIESTLEDTRGSDPDYDEDGWFWSSISHNFKPDDNGWYD